MRSAGTFLFALGTFAFIASLKQGSITSIEPFYWWLIMGKITAVGHRRAQEAMLPAFEDDSTPLLERGRRGHGDYAAAPS